MIDFQRTKIPRKIHILFTWITESYVPFIVKVNQYILRWSIIINCNNYRNVCDRNSKDNVQYMERRYLFARMVSREWQDLLLTTCVIDLRGMLILTTKHLRLEWGAASLCISYIICRNVIALRNYYNYRFEQLINSRNKRHVRLSRAQLFDSSNEKKGMSYIEIIYINVLIIH